MSSDSKGKSRLWQLLDLGQSIWLDSIQRGQIKSGELKRLMLEEAVRGETANPSIFEKAIGSSTDYDDQIRELVRQGLDANAIYERVATDDVRMACDVFRPVYDETNGADGFVSLEVSPRLAYDTQGTIAEVRRFWKIVDRPNLMIKIPGTREGVPAIEQSLYEGININITLLFAVSAYEDVAWAFIRALERRVAEGKPIDHIASVASFFVSRIDTLADMLIDEKIKDNKNPQLFEELNDLKGKIAIANAKVAYQRFKEIFGDSRYTRLKDKGVRVQRPLWASTSTKNPNYPDTMYVDALIGPDTVNTLPLDTIYAFKDHGHVERTVDKDVDQAVDILKRFEAAGFSLNGVTSKVLEEGVEKFDESLAKLLKVIEGKRSEKQKEAQPAGAAPLAAPGARLDEVKKNDIAARIWSRDPSLWSADPQRQELIRNRLGWLDTPSTMSKKVGELKDFADEVEGADFKHVLLLGMGGSSLTSEVMSIAFGIARGRPNFGVLDTTDPATVREYVRTMPPEDTLYLVSSKSGETIETLALYKFFYDQVLDKRREKVCSSFVVITDPGTPLERFATERNFRQVFTSSADIVGRFAALSYYGLVPAALMGVDLDKLLASAQGMVKSCDASVPADQNPGVVLGAMLADYYSKGRDKITLVLSPEIDRFGSWLEQLLAESTGKASEPSGDPKGLVVIDGEPLHGPEVYGSDRVFVYLRLEEGKENDAYDDQVDALEKAGQPVIRLALHDVYSLGGEFFRWQFATAVAGALMGVNPFDEPNVEESKEYTKRVLLDYVKDYSLPKSTPTAAEDDIELYWSKPLRRRQNLEQYLIEFLGQVEAGDYFALMAFLTHSRLNERALTEMRVALRDKYHAATMADFGPRFLHSTGQLFKGGPNKGVFIQITGTDSKDAEIPHEEYSFGVLKQAQAMGDLQALEEHGRRVLRLHLANGVEISRLAERFSAALEVRVEQVPDKTVA